MSALTYDVVSRIPGVVAGGLPAHEVHDDGLVVGDGREGSDVGHGLVEGDAREAFVGGVASDVAVQFHDDAGPIDGVCERKLVSGVHHRIVLTHLTIRRDIAKKTEFEGHGEHVSTSQTGVYARRSCPKG